MTDAKVTALTPLTTFSGDESFYVVEDDDGTPVSRQVTVENLRRGLIEPGQVVQVVTAQSTAADSTTSTTLQASSLSATITPRFADSVLFVEVEGDFTAERVAGSPTERRGAVAIQNTTDAVQIAYGFRGAILVAGSSVTARQYAPIALKGRYTVNSTTARTFQLQYASIEATNVQAAIVGNSPRVGVEMSITEIRA